MVSMLHRLPALVGSILVSPLRLLLAAFDFVGGADRLVAQRKAIRERTPFVDEAFVAALEVGPLDGAIVIAVRDVVASTCGVAASSLRPEDRLDVLERLPELLGPPVEWSDLLNLIEEYAEITIPAKRYDERSWGRVGDRDYVANLQQLAWAIIAIAHRDERP